MILRVEAIPTPDFGEGEPTPGPWLRVSCDDPFLRYEVCVEADDCAQALGEKIQRLVFAGSD